VRGRCEHGLKVRECYVCISPRQGEPPHYPHRDLAHRLRMIGSGNWTLKGEEGWLLKAADILDKITEPRDD